MAGLNKTVGYQFPPNEEKKNRSFWGKLFGTSKKSNKEKGYDDSFRRQSTLYHSFHCTNLPPDGNSAEDEAETFTTLESSAFVEMHKDAGIIFINKDPITNYMTKEEDRHVQFVPTPMNKYYKVDVKAAPSKRSKSDDDKENSSYIRTSKPVRPILRLGKSKESLSCKDSASDRQNFSDVSKTKVSVMYVDGPQVKKTPNIPRTSTKIALFDRANGSLPHLNVSGITQYGTLPRTAKICRERHCSEEGGCGMGKDMLFFPPIETHQVECNCCNFPDGRCQKKPMRRVDQSGCFSIPDIPRHVEQKQFLRQTVGGSSQNVFYSQYIGEPLRREVRTENRNDLECYDRSHDGIKPHAQVKQQPKTVASTRESTINVASNKVAGQKGQFTSTRSLQSNAGMSRFHEGTMACPQLPNKAINEIGLPIMRLKTEEQWKSMPPKIITESPHYIHLADTYSSNGQIKPININYNSQNINQQPTVNYVISGNRNKFNDFAMTQNQTNISSNNRRTNSANNVNPMQKQIDSKESGVGVSHFMSQSRKQAIRSSMYVQRRKFVNKMCKYKSKECEDGFSSMADDECSFNCSCSSCMAKFSKDNRRNTNRISLPEDKFFFICTDEVKGESILDSVPEEPATPDKPKSTGEVLDTIPEQPLSNTWYDCNDSLCKTPMPTNRTDEEKVVIPQTPDYQKDRIVESIYENITQIINSATKRNFKAKDVERMFSTPISKTKNKEVSERKTGGKFPRALFSSTDNLAARPKGNGPRKSQSPAKSPLVFSDSVILLQEIFQKLSQECKELLQPNASTTTATRDDANTSASSNCSGSRYVNDLVKNLRSKEISEGDFASIIGGIAQNIFLEAKLKQTGRSLTQSASLPNLANEDAFNDLRPKPGSSMEDVFSGQGKAEGTPNANTASDSGFRTDGDTQNDSAVKDGPSSENLGDRHFPEGWSRSPTTENDVSNSPTEKSSSSKEDSRNSEFENQLLENVIRLGMGLSPISKVDKSTFYSSSPAKATKYKSRDVLSGKGKLKLKIYNNSGLVTVHVMRAAKLNRINGRDLNPYIKICMVPDNSRRVHWRTTVQKGQKNPAFNQKFSFEILDEDMAKRLVFSVWHRDMVKERSELVGCMSFSVRHVLDDTHKIDGWYRLLREGFGTQKHFAAHTKKNSCPSRPLQITEC